MLSDGEERRTEPTTHLIHLVARGSLGEPERTDKFAPV